MNSAQISFKATDTANHVTEQVYENINSAASPTQIRDFVQNVDDLSPDTYSDVSLTVRDELKSADAPTFRITAAPDPDRINDFNSRKTADNTFTANLFDVPDWIYLITDTDAKPRVVRVPTFANVGFTDETVDKHNEFRDFNFAEAQAEYDNTQDVNEKASIAERIAWATEAKDGKHFWHIQQVHSTNVNGIGDDWNYGCGDYIISFPATDNFSAATFKFTLVPYEG